MHKLSVKHRIEGNPVIIHQTRTATTNIYLISYNYIVNLSYVSGQTILCLLRNLTLHLEQGSVYSLIMVAAWVESDFETSSVFALVLFSQPALFLGAYHIAGEACSYYFAASH